MWKKGFSFKIAAYVLILLIFSNFSMANKIIYVDDDANGVNDGSSWQNAYIYLQDALTDVKNAEKPIEIRVAQGIYKPNQGLNPIWGQMASFSLINGVTIKGGYAGLNEPNPDEISVEFYKSILSGDLNGDDIEVEDSADLIIQKTYNDNSLNIVSSHGNDANAVLDGFTISSGFNMSWADPGPSGGAGMFIYNHSKPIIINCTFTCNTARDCGGGILIFSSNPTILNCTFTKNYANSGAGIFSGKGSGHSSPEPSNPIIYNCVFNNNYAYYGAGMYNYSGKPKLSNSTFKSNTSENSGAGIYSSDIMEIKYCNFITNIASNGGGIATDANLTLENCIFSGNRAISSSGGGGACRLFGKNTMITNCTFCGNWSLPNITLAKNSSSLIKIINSIIWDGQNTLPQSSLSSILVKYSDIQGGIEGEGNINSDPFFANPGYWDLKGTPYYLNDDVWIDGSYHLKSQAGRFDPNTQTWFQDDVTSPCIDSGDPNSPIGLETFPNGGRINMGAYGSTSEASKSYFGKPVCTTIVAGDINGDCKVDVLDFEIMLLHWLEEH
jgi:parallel beta-helix repeat protein/predicted outer membrane repeat protein